MRMFRFELQVPSRQAGKTSSDKKVAPAASTTCEPVFHGFSHMSTGWEGKGKRRQRRCREGRGCSLPEDSVGFERFRLLGMGIQVAAKRARFVADAEQTAVGAPVWTDGQTADKAGSWQWFCCGACKQSSRKGDREEI